MTHQFFEHYNFSENELRKRIYDALCQLHQLDPNQWTEMDLKMTHPSESSEQVVAIFLSDHAKELVKLWYSKQIPEIEFVKLVCIIVEFHLDNAKLKDLLTKLSLKNTLHIHYLLISSLLIENVDIEKKYNVKIDEKRFRKNLLTSSETLMEKINLLRAVFEIDLLINTILSSNEEELTVNLIEKFRKSVFEYIAENSVEAVRSTEVLLFTEAVAKYADILSEGLDAKRFTTTEEGRYFVKLFKKAARKIDSRRLGIKQGGRRKKKGFKWNEIKNKVEFYETVETLPKINGTPMWDYAYEELNEKDFNYKIIDYLRTESVFKQVPSDLFKHAVRTWRKYSDSFNVPKPDEKPRAFAFYHALRLLGFPETPYSSLKKYYGEGKKHYITNNLNKEKSK